MGADGHIIIARLADFEEANPAVKPSDIGLRTGTVLGVDACWGYYGDNLMEPNYGKEWDIERVYDANASKGKYFRKATNAEEIARNFALDWFETNAETHEVWT